MFSGLQQNVSLSNDTYQSVKRTGHMVSSRFNTLLALVNSLSVTAEYGSRPHSLERSSSLVDSQSSNITSASYRAITESRGLRVNITEMAAVVRNINSTSKAATSNLKQAWDTGKIKPSFFLSNFKGEFLRSLYSEFFGRVMRSNQIESLVMTGKRRGKESVRDRNREALMDQPGKWRESSTIMDIWSRINMEAAVLCPLTSDVT